MSQLPSPIRAALGLAAEAAEQARHLPDKAIELPMLAVSTALQFSLRAQQQYARLAAKGDDILNHRETTDAPPPWATFDPPVDGAAPDASPTAEDPADEPAQGNTAQSNTAQGNTAQGNTAQTGKSVKPPRNGAPSRFDSIGDE